MFSGGIDSKKKEYCFYRLYEREVLGIKDSWSKCGTRLGQISLLAIVIVGSLGLAGILPSSQMGWSAVGIGAGYMALKLFVGQEKGKRALSIEQYYKRRTFDLLTSACIASVIIAIGTLGGLDILPCIPCSAALIGVVVLTSFLSCIHSCSEVSRKHELFFG